MDYLVRVDIQTGQVLENNLREFWDRQSCSEESTEAERGGLETARAQPRRSPSPPEAPTGSKARAGTPQDEALRERVQKFNSGRSRRNKHAWSNAELYRLAILVGLQKRNYKQAAARLARSPRACRLMFKEMKKAGVI